MPLPTRWWRRLRASLVILAVSSAVVAVLYSHPPEALSLFVQNQLAQRFLPGPPQRDMAIDAATKTAVIEAMITALEAHYIDAKMGQTLARALHERLENGAFDHVEGAKLFSFMLTNQLQALSGDRHLGVRYSEAVVPDPSPDGQPSVQERDVELADNRRHNFGVGRIERLPFNIGYIELISFPSAGEVGDRYAAVMTLLKDTRSLIIDLRHNHGGEPSGVALFASYLLDQRTRLTDIYYRDSNTTEEMWSTQTLAGPRYGSQREVFVLTSEETFSGGEDLAYTLQALKRATVIGEATGGGAHPGQMKKLNDHFSMFVPNGTAINSVTHSNWEGTGVIPDEKRSAEKALARAQVLTLQKRIEVEPDEATKERMREEINELR